MRHTIIIDFDGTLHDSAHTFAIALRAGIGWLVERGLLAPCSITDEEAAGFLGMTDDDMWRTFAPSLDTPTRAQVISVVGDAMDGAVAAGRGRLFSGIPAALGALKDAGHTLVFLSNCHHRYQEVSRRAFGLDAWFSAYYNAEDARNIPKEQIFAQSIACDFEGPYLVMGDRSSDLAVARAHNLKSIGCLYGYGTPEELADATTLAQTPADIPALVAQLTSAQ